MGIFRYLLIVFLLVPLLEVYLMIKVGSIIGAVPTVMLVILTAVLGAWLVRLQGLLTVSRARGMLLSGQMPAVEALEGRGAALIANHGMVAVAPTPAKALHITGLVERSARIVWGARLLGPLHPLPDSVNASFAGIYGYLRANP